MPLTNNLLEFVFKMTSVRQTDLGGGKRRLEADFAGEVSGREAGTAYGTLTTALDENDDPSKPNAYTWTGTTLTNSGAVLYVSASGILQRTGKGHNLRLRSVGRISTKDTKLAAFNNVVAAFEVDFDAETNTMRGVGLEWA